MAGSGELSFAAMLRLILLLVAAGVLLWALSDVVLLVFAAVLLAVLLRRTVEVVAHLAHLPVPLAFALVVAAILAAVLGLGWFAGPSFAAEGQQLIKEIYNYFGHLQHRYDKGFWGKMLGHVLSGGHSFGLGPLAPRLLTATFGTAGASVLLIATALYLAVTPRLYMRGTILLVPPAHRQRAAELLALLAHVLRHWMLGQLIDMAVVGVLATLGLWLLGIPLALALGVLAGLLTFVPYLGAVLAAIPAIIVASTVGLASILWVVLLYTGCHVVEGYFVAPVVSRRTVHLPPAVTVLSMAVLGELYGFPGILIATPLTAAVIVLVKELYVRDFLGTDLPPPDMLSGPHDK